MGRCANISPSLMDNQSAIDELLMSHDELHIVCKTMMDIILNSGLENDLDEKLKQEKVAPGFATRAIEIEQKFSQRRKVLMATGQIQ